MCKHCLDKGRSQVALSLIYLKDRFQLLYHLVQYIVFLGARFQAL
jgi:hypothetical protein